jgi:hypothetical protein
MRQRRSKLKTRQYIKGNPDFYIGSDSCEVVTLFPRRSGMPQIVFTGISRSGRWLPGVSFSSDL